MSNIKQDYARYIKAPSRPKPKRNYKGLLLILIAYAIIGFNAVYFLTNF